MQEVEASYCNVLPATTYYHLDLATTSDCFLSTYTCASTYWRQAILSTPNTASIRNERRSEAHLPCEFAQDSTQQVAPKSPKYICALHASARGRRILDFTVTVTGQEDSCRFAWIEKESYMSTCTCVCAVSRAGYFKHTSKHSEQ